jgi:hypothetical protein
MGRTARFDLDQANRRNRRYLAGCARIDEGPESTLLSRSEEGRLGNALGQPEMLSGVCRCSGMSGVTIMIEKSPNC